MPLFLERFFHDIGYSLRTLSASKSRTFLTMLGVIIGVMSVLAVTSIGLSAQQLVVGQVSSLGTNLIAVLPGGGQDTGPPPIAFGVVTTTLKDEDAEVVARLPNVVAVSPYARSIETVTYRNETKSISVSGVSPDILRVEDFTVADGRFFSTQEASGYGRVAVLGFKAREALFGEDDPIGQQIRIKGLTFTVVGAVGERGTVFFQDQDDQIMIPYTTAEKLVQGQDFLTFLRAKAADGADATTVQEDIRRAVRRRHGITDPAKDDFTVRTTEQAISILSNVTGAIKGFLLIVTAISLVVGGINIMNVMFVAVRERTREIGLRKALGARPYRIMTQFLIESAFISLIGGALGVLLGAGVTGLAALVIGQLGYDWPFILPLASVGWSLAIAGLIGVLFGSWPAASAARLDPISSLRYE